MASLTSSEFTESQLIATALALIGSRQTLSSDEQRLCTKSNSPINPKFLTEIRSQILREEDPLGDMFIDLRPAPYRRKLGATYTPRSIIDSMIRWARTVCKPKKVVDPGAGSGRFLLAAAKVFPQARLVAIELDPLAALLLRANLTVRGLASRTEIYVADYRDLRFEPSKTVTLFIGNPPYVRHHDISPSWKSWFSETAKLYGVKASQLAGLHIHFFLQTLRLGKAGDVGAFITAAEWLDVNYGATLRTLLTEQLGAISIHKLAATSLPFAGTTTTGVITCFQIGAKPSHLRIREVRSPERLNGLSTGRKVPAEVARTSLRWSVLIRPSPPPPPEHISLGELFRVHRGQVTGNNDIWVTAHDHDLPIKVLIPTVTRAKEIIESGSALTDEQHLKRVINLPIDLDEIDRQDRPAIERFLRWAASRGGKESYIARHRKAWWAVELRNPAPILCTYMARRPPAFTLNLCAARHINIAHGLYPIQPLPVHLLDRLIRWLHEHLGQHNGRTYAGGLTKFEPRELERVPIPSLERLAGW